MENLYLKIQDKKLCNGCGICTLQCPKHCISMEEDSEGFLYPVIDEEKCIHCNRCKNICSNYNESSTTGEAYIAINKNEEERKHSASGGMFYILAKYTISKHGIVFGATYDENLKVKHEQATSLDECKKFMGSKYVRSDMTGIYQQIKGYVEDGRMVLFTGTPCQCKAVKEFLGKDYDNLILCEIICHGNPSPKVFEKYIKELEKNENTKVLDVQFRSKENGWSNSTPIITFKDGKKLEDPTFYRAFISELISRPSCHECPFVTIHRNSDFTIGDLWGIEKIAPEMNDEKGVSLLLANTNKAKNILNEVNTQMELKPTDITEAISYNHNKNDKQNKNRNKFFYEINQKNKSVIKLMNKYTKVSLLKRGIRKIKKIIS